MLCRAAAAAVQAALRAKEAGSTRFCMGAAWRGPSQVCGWLLPAAVAATAGSGPCLLCCQASQHPHGMSKSSAAGQAALIQLCFVASTSKLLEWRRWCIRCTTRLLFCVMPCRAMLCCPVLCCPVPSQVGPRQWERVLEMVRRIRGLGMEVRTCAAGAGWWLGCVQQGQSGGWRLYRHAWLAVRSTKR